MMTLYAGLDDVIKKNRIQKDVEREEEKISFWSLQLVVRELVCDTGRYPVEEWGEEKEKKKRRGDCCCCVVVIAPAFLTAPVFFTGAQGGDLLLKLNCIAAWLPERAAGEKSNKKEKDKSFQQFPPTPFHLGKKNRLDEREAISKIPCAPNYNIFFPPLSLRRLFVAL